jgi:hypothetical protein
MTEIDRINEALDKIWHDHSIQYKYAPFQYARPKKRAIVYVGLNPSFSEDGWNEIIKARDYKGPPPRKVFAWPRNRQYEGHAHTLEKAAQKHYSYFQHHHDFAKIQKKPWKHFEHFDIFAYRATSQDDLKKLVLGRHEILNAFGQAQFRQFERLLCLADPAIVVVINALAARIYCRERDLGDSDVVTGYRTDNINNRKVPVFLSGMLTGGATDKYSRERLFWHVGQALKAIPAVKRTSKHRRKK